MESANRSILEIFELLTIDFFLSFFLPELGGVRPVQLSKSTAELSP